MQTTDVTRRQDGFTARKFLLGPALMAGYGLVRPAGRAVGDYGPGAWWSVAHLLFLAGVLAFVPVFRGLRMPDGARGAGRAGSGWRPGPGCWGWPRSRSRR
ncbi:hypothetical protein ACFV6Z_29240 [Streptomyces sp. NPDC059818]|uniref:hypothetical protein n=1 Tax=Streptomyces sp. NPDC059818 TaxID=3346962 RepID=UPI003663ECCA